MYVELAKVKGYYVYYEVYFMCTLVWICDWCHLLFIAVLIPQDTHPDLCDVIIMASIILAIVISDPFFKYARGAWA